MHHEMLKHTDLLVVIGVNASLNPEGDPVQEGSEVENKANASAWRIFKPAARHRHYFS